MEEPNRSKILKSYEILCGQWDETVARARENVAAGTDDADIIAFEGGALLAHEGQTIDNLAFTLAAVMLKQAKESPRVKGARKAAVPAKRPRKKATLQDVKDARAINAAVMDRLIEVDSSDRPGMDAISELTEARLKEAGDDVAAA